MRLPFNQQAHRLDRRVSATALANGFGNGARDCDVAGGQVEVVGNEEGPRTDNRCAGGTDARRAEVGEALGCGDFSDERFKLSLAQGGKIAALGSRGRRLVEIDRDIEFAGNAFAQRSGQRSALLERDILDGDEGNYIGRPNARVLPLMLKEVDQA